MEFKKAELTYFAKKCAKTTDIMLLGICYASEIVHTDLGRKISNQEDEELLLEISKRYAKYCNNESAFDVDNAETQNFQSIIAHIVTCCDEHNWFRDSSD